MKQIITTIKTGLALGLFALTSTLSFGQTTVYDVIAASPNHTSLTAALDQEGLDAVLDDNMSTFTVFAPDNAAFDNLATALGTDIWEEKYKENLLFRRRDDWNEGGANKGNSQSIGVRGMN